MSRVCLVYDCLHPWTIGGAERRLRDLADRLTAEGHEVTYLTLRQWPRGASPGIPGVRVVAVGPPMALYTASGRRRVLPPLVFGLGVLAHLARAGGRYDIVHTAAFPWFSVLAAAAARRVHRFGLVVEWQEWWTREAWRAYLGPRFGLFGWAVQRACARVRQEALCYADGTARRLRAGGLRGQVTVLRGLYAGPHAGDAAVRAPAPPARPPVAVFAGRHIPEKQVTALPAALRVARRSVPGLRLDVFGDGPDRPALEAAVAAAGVAEAARLHGFADPARLDAALRAAACLVLPSRREGFGLVVVEAAARGCPSVVVAHPDNAAAELVEEGVNGTLAPSASPDDLGAAIVRAVTRPALRETTARWYAEHAAELSLEGSLAVLAERYARA